MFDYLFPIFAFGLVITGIVFLGLQQAADLAKDLAAQRSGAEKNSEKPDPVSPRHNSTPAKASAKASRP
jgi:hypothetical protein